MFAKLLTLILVFTVALAKEYPPGVHPAVCPNFPYCDVDALTRHTLDGTPIPQWGLNSAIRAVLPLDPFVGIPDQYPAGVDPALCPDYPYCW